MSTSSSAPFITHSEHDAIGGGHRASVQRALDALCDRLLPELHRPVSDAIRYSLLGEGKRLRAILLIEAYRACGGESPPYDLAAAIEVVHAYSLVHDDLPCMDDDAVRRGRPTVHRVYGVPVATLAGLSMVPMAARAAWAACSRLQLDPSVTATCVRELMVASGAGGMIGGQLLDLEAEGRAVSAEELEQVHRKKTGMLIQASVKLGARAAGAPGATVSAFAEYGAAIGLAFQIADDVLDRTATTDQLGKTAGRDLALHKSTYPALLGIEGARSRARDLVDQACNALRGAGVLTPPLESLARFIVERNS